MSLKPLGDFSIPDPACTRLDPMISLMCAVIRDAALIILGHPWTVRHACGAGEGEFFRRKALALFEETVNWMYFNADMGGIGFEECAEAIRVRVGEWYHPDLIRRFIKKRYAWLFPEGTWYMRADATRHRQVDFFWNQENRMAS